MSVSISLVTLALLAGVAVAAPPRDALTMPTPASLDWRALLVSETAAATPNALVAQAPASQPITEKPESAPAPAPSREFKGLSAYWNVREAYSEVAAHQLEISVGSGWDTFYHGGHDYIEMWEWLAYGLTDDLMLGLKVREPLGYGGRGVPELEPTVFWTLWHEREILPAFGTYGTLRLPTGYQSANVDGRIGGVLTKSIFPRFRAHFEGWVQINGNNSGIGDERHAAYESGSTRRGFIWAVGPGVDYQLFDGTLLVFNYLQRSAEYNGDGNTHMLELGVVQKLWDHARTSSDIKFAFDVGASGQQEEPHIGLKLQYEFFLK